MTTTENSEQLVTVLVDGQLFGVPVMLVEDVLGPQKITRIPLAPAEVDGALNLRGRIVTAIDLRTRLGLPKRAAEQDCMSVVVEHEGEPYSFLIDSVGEVLSLPVDGMERNPATLDPTWREVSAGIYRLEGELLVMLDVQRLLDFGQNAAVAA